MENVRHAEEGAETRFGPQHQGGILRARVHALRKAERRKEAAEAIRANLGAGRDQAVLMMSAALAAKLQDPSLERQCLSECQANGHLSPKLLSRLIELQMAEGRWAEALAVLQAQDPSSLDAGDAFRRAECLGALGRSEDAFQVLDALMSAERPSDETVAKWATVMVDLLKRPTDVLARLQPQANHPEANWAVHAGLGRAFHALDRTAEAIDSYKASVSCEPQRAEVWHELGSVYRHLGRVEEAQHAFEHALQLDPENPRTLRVAGYDHRYQRDDEAFKRVQRALLGLARYRKASQVELHYASAKAYEDVSDIDRAFEHYARAGALQKEISPWSEGADRALLTFFSEQLTRERLRAARARGFGSSKPVFVVGVPRSGTTLVEEILSRHPEGFGAGETKLVATSLDGMGIGGTGLRTRRDGTPPLKATPEERGRAYVTALVAKADERPSRIVDKLPANYLWLGLIDTILPDAYFVHCRRHPLDACLSQYRHYFGDEVPYSYDLRDLGRAYRLYNEFMQLWARLLPPGRIHHVDYEDLVAQPQSEVRRLLDYVDLPWSEACLASGVSGRAIRTASATQARQPIYQNAVGRWRLCERQLKPLIDEIGDLVEIYERERGEALAAQTAVGGA